MIFSSFTFLFFFLTVLLLVIVAPQRIRKFILLAASYFFYGYWDYRFLVLIFASTVVDFGVGRWLSHVARPSYRKLLLTLSIITNLGFLGFFKYYNFFVDSANAVLSTWGWGVSNLHIILPVGISFFTFQTMSYTIDVYRRKLEPVEHFADFALFVAFFPQLVAGPIVRASDFLPQLKRPVRVTSANLWAGSQIFIIGLFKKLMIADAVAPLVDRVYAYPGYFDSYTVWLAVIAYSLQIYGDFSGYSDMAIGCARILGYRFHRNFDMPYLSRDIAEFWRRWHISLSSWLRDYLYIALGGNRKGHMRTYANLMLTMTLGGLWHGASWNFVAWGVLHGLALSVHRAWRHRQGAVQASSGSRRLVRTTVSAVATFLFVTLVWVLFRAPDTQTGLTIYSKLFLLTPDGAAWHYTLAYVAVVWCIVGHIAGSWRAKEELVFFSTPDSYRAAFATITILLFIYLFAPTNISPFIYFQF